MFDITDFTRDTRICFSLAPIKLGTVDAISATITHTINASNIALPRWLFFIFSVSLFLVNRHFPLN
jgi:hypothetical protein